MKTAFTVLPGETSGAAMLTTPADTAFLTAAIKKEVRTKELSAREIMRHAPFERAARLFCLGKGLALNR